MLPRRSDNSFRNRPAIRQRLSSKLAAVISRPSYRINREVTTYGTDIVDCLNRAPVRGVRLGLSRSHSCCLSTALLHLIKNILSFLAASATQNRSARFDCTVSFSWTGLLILRNFSILLLSLSSLAISENSKNINVIKSRNSKHQGLCI